MPLPALSPELRRFLMIQQGLHPALFNFALNAGIAWLLFRDNSFLTLWNEGAIGPDLLITGVLLPLLSGLIVTRIVTGQIAKGGVPALGVDAPGLDAPGWHRRSPLARSSYLAVLGLLFGAVPAIALIATLGAEPMSVVGYALFKGLWTALLAAAMSPFIAWWALLAAEGKTQPILAIEGTPAPGKI